MEDEKYLLIPLSNPHAQEIANFVHERIGFIEPHEYAVSPDWYTRMNFCGCGCPEEVMNYIEGILSALKTRSETSWEVDTVDQAIGGEKYGPQHYFIMYVLDAMGLTEHGGGVLGCWLSEKGIQFLNKLKMDKK